jgi:hypothetical protein
MAGYDAVATLLPRPEHGRRRAAGVHSEPDY